MLREIEKIERVKKVFVRSGIRFDYLMCDKDDSFFRQLVSRHVSGQLKVAPEHCSNNALTMMGKPPIEVYESFRKKYFALCESAGLEQYLVPYLMSSHPGTTMKDAVEMAVWLKKWGYMPEQVQDFYPTPGTISTVMYYTGINPMNGKSVYVSSDYREKLLQRALLQYSKPENANLVREALKLAGREDLIGNGSECLVRPAFAQGGRSSYENGKGAKKNSKDVKKTNLYIKPSRTGKSDANFGKKSKSNGSFKKSSPGNKKNVQHIDKSLVKKGSKSKFDRIFGEDATRIRLEASRLEEKSTKRVSNSNKNSVKTPNNRKNKAK